MGAVGEVTEMMAVDRSKTKNWSCCRDWMEVTRQEGHPEAAAAVWSRSGSRRKVQRVISSWLAGQSALPLAGKGDS